ncbi:MAG: N-acyl homoserine lactonase family protein [Desulfarculus sp.]|jgi:glyoxylase-like metal-dependent hydrolase (beta-lactamase superfamily II)|nr:MAG: N-acyl homoserine lactonase family protein [Desulfarculus sp.]
MSDYRIWPLNTGTIIVDKGGYITRGQGLGIEVEIPATAWYLSDGQHKVLVDTGMCHTDLAHWHHGGSQQGPDQAVHKCLARLGVDPADIELIIFTHLHWDHCHNLDQFPRARMVVSQTELAFALEPIPPYYKSYEYSALGKRAPFLNRNFEQINGEVDVLPGLTIFPTPGHSPGHQSVAVSTSGGVHVITGDAVFAYVNLQPAGPHLPFNIMGRFADIVASWHSLEEITRRADVVLPGHDMAVFDSPVYPRQGA